MSSPDPLDILSEDVLTLREAVNEFPRNRRPHISTLWRWARRGVRGAKLETCKVGAVTVTSKQALNRFERQLNS